MLILPSFINRVVVSFALLVLMASGAAAQITVTPDGGLEANRSIHTTGHAATFTVTRSAGSGFGTLISFTCTVASVVTTCAPPASISLAPGQSQNVNVTYAVGNEGSGTVTLKAASLAGNDDGYKTVPVVLPSGAPRMSTLPYLDAKQDYGRCAASCFAVTHAQSTVPYFSLDRPRSVTLAYHGDRLAPKPFVLVDVWPDAGYAGGNPTEYHLEVKIDGVSATLHNGGAGQTKHYFSFVNSAPHRIGVQFTPPASLVHGDVKPMEILVTAKFASGTLITNRWITWYLHVDEAKSAVAKGWTLAGIQRAFVVASVGVMITEGDGSATFFRYNASTTKYETPVGDFTTLVQSGVNWTRAYPDSTKVTFNSSGLMVRSADRWGVRDTILYTGTKVTTIRDPLDNAIAIAYGAAGISTITDPMGRVTTMSVAAADSTLAWIQDPDGFRTNFGYDASKRLLTVTPRNAKTTTFAYHTQTGKLKSITAPTIAILGGNAAPVTTDSAWHMIGVPYQTTATVSPLFTPRLADTAYARILEPGGAMTRFSVNRWGSPVRTIGPVAEGQPDTTTVLYSSDGFPIRVIRPGYGGTDRDTLGYNASGLLVYSKPAGDTTTSITYGAYAQPATVARRAQDSTTYFLGSLGRIDSVRVGTTTVAKVASYDGYGRPTTIRRPNADSTVFAYVVSGTHRNLSSVTISGNRTTSYQYDVYGRRSSTAAPLVPRDSVNYDLINRVTASRQKTAAGTVLSTSFLYDSMANVVQVTDPKGQTYKFRYNALGWLIRQEDPATKRDTMVYSVDGDLMQHTTRRNLTRTFTYDALHRVKTRGPTSLSYFYPDHGRRLIAISPVATDSIGYNVRGQPDSAITRLAGQRYARNYAYIRSGLLDSLRVTGGGAAFTNRKYTYDYQREFLTAIRLNGSQTTLTPDASLADSARTFPASGSSSLRVFGSLRAPVKITTPAGWAATTEKWLGFDQLGRINQQLNWLGKSGRFFVYDSLGRVATASDSSTSGTPPAGCPNLTTGSLFCHGMLTWTLTPGTLKNYSFDVVGNRTDLGGTYAAGTNRITGFNSCTYATNAAGSDSVRTCGATVTNFTWNADDQLTGLAVTGQPTAAYDYDAFGRIVKKTSAGSAAAHFLWDGDHLLAELNGTGTATTAEFSYYPGMDKLHALILGTNRYYAHADGLGNVIALTDTTGALKRTLTYDDWGQLTSSWDGAGTIGNKDRPRWKGALWMGPETELYYMRNRWYEPGKGRFISEDPIGLRGGINPALFANGDPVSNRDTDGRSCERVYGEKHSIDSKGNVTVTGYSYLVCVSSGVSGPIMIVLPPATPLGSSTPFGFDPSRPRQVVPSSAPLPCSGDTYFSGFALDAVALYGVTLAFGSYRGPTRSGLYLRVGTSSGLDISLGLEAGFQRSFEGVAQELQVGLGPSAVARASGGGYALSYGVGLPGSARGGVVNTFTLPVGQGVCQ